MNRYIDFVLKRPKFVIAVIAIISFVMFLGIFKLEFENSLEVMMPKNDAEYILNEKTKEIYGNNGNFLIMCVSADDVLETGFLKKLDKMHSDLEEFNQFDEELGKERINSFNEAAKKAPLSSEDLFTAFHEDPIFQRTVKRKYNKLLHDKTILDQNDLKSLKKELLHTQNLKKKELIDLILSPYTAEDVKGEDDTLITFSVIEKDESENRIIPETKEEIDEFRKRLTNNPAYEKGIYSKNKETGKITDLSLILRLQSKGIDYSISDEFKEIGKSYPSLNAIIQGIPYVNREVNHYMQADLKTFLPLVILVVAIIFFLNFRTLRGVALPFITLNLADIWILGLMGHLGYKLSIMGTCLPPLMLAVGSSYSIHILNQYYIDYDSIVNGDKIKGLKNSMLHISLTVALAGFTTFVGFMMLMTNEIYAIKEWGIFSAIGVLFAMFLATSLIPAFLVLLPNKNPERKIKKDEKESNLPLSGLVDRIIHLFTFLATKHHKKVLACTFIVIIIAAAGAFRVVAETAIFSYFKEGDPILTSSKVIGEKFGGSMGLNILLDSGEKNGIMDPEFLNYIEDLRIWLEKDENIDLLIGRSDSFTDFIKTMHLAMNNNDHDYYKIPEQRIDVESYIETFSGDDDNDDGRIDAFESYVDKEFRTANLFVRMWEKKGKPISSVELQYAIDKIENHLRSDLPEKYSFSITGEPKILQRLVYHIVHGQMKSLLFSLIAVGLIVVLLFKNFGAGLMALIPISVAVLFNFGVMGWFGIRLDTATAIIAAITIGIGIDDTIHFLNTYRYYRSRDYSVDDTIKMTLSISGKAIIYTSLALIFGFLILTVSNFKPIIWFSFLTAVTMVATTIGALLVLPATIKATGVKLEETESNSPVWKILDINRLFRLEENNE